MGECRESEWESGRMKKMKRWNERVAVVCCRCRDGSDPVVVCRAGVERCIRYEGIAGCALCKHAGWSILLVARMAAVSAPMRAQSTRAWSDTLCVGIHFCVDHNQRAGMGISLVSEQPVGDAAREGAAGSIGRRAEPHASSTRSIITWTFWSAGDKAVCSAAVEKNKVECNRRAGERESKR